MMMKDTISNDMINIVLRQMGATTIKTKPAHITIAKFELNDSFRITYLYEIKENEGAYLQRVDPYPMMMGKLYNEEDIVTLIKRDLNKFKSAQNSTNFTKFLEVASHVAAFEKEIENLFLLNNVSAENLDKIDSEMNNVHKLIDDIASSSTPLDGDIDAK